MGQSQSRRLQQSWRRGLTRGQSTGSAGSGRLLAGAVVPQGAVGREDGPVGGVDRRAFTTNLSVRHHQVDTLGAVRTAGKVWVVARWKGAMGWIVCVAHVVYTTERGRRRGRCVDERGHGGIGTHESRQTGRAAVLRTRPTHWQWYLAPVELGQVIPGLRRGQRAHGYYRLPFGGIRIRLGVTQVGGYPDGWSRLDGGFRGSHGGDDESRR